MSHDAALSTAAYGRAAAATNVATSRRPYRWLGALFVFEALLSFAPVVVLGAAIGWPASLDQPAAVQLTAIRENAGAVTFGYALYLVYSVLVAPLMIGAAAVALGGLHRPLAATVAALAALSALARSIGILRWLTVMPALAAEHAAADAGQRGVLEAIFNAVTTYGGGIGEVLGVSLFMAAALGVLSVGAWLARTLPVWLAALGTVSAALLAGLMLPLAGAPEVIPVALAVSVLSLWMLVFGVWLMRRRAA